MTDQDPFAELVRIIAALRDPDSGCPWDLKQTHESLKPYVIEEAYELVEAIDDFPENIKEELGDLLLQVVLHSQIASEAKNFDINDVVRGISQKLIDRHPHVFGDATADDADEVVSNWEKIKQNEAGAPKSVLAGIPKSMPALLKAQRIGDRVARVGFDWDDAAGVKEKVEEELREFLEALQQKDNQREKIHEELGDLLFTLAQLTRKLDYDPEEVLQSACKKFSDRFQKMEEEAQFELETLSKDELEDRWKRVKE